MKMRIHITWCGNSRNSNRSNNHWAENHVDKLAKHYLGMDKYPRRSPDEKRMLIKIKAEKIHHQDYS